MNPLFFKLLNVDKSEIRNLRQVTVLDTYVGATKNFHDEGLYSVPIFGPVGSEKRETTFAWIDCNVEIISPAIALALFEMKHLYADIMAGVRYAVWDDKEKDFFAAAVGDKDANTGYSFFISKFLELTPKPNASLIRQQNIELFEKYKEIAVSRYALVYPAGMRDIVVKDDGREQEDDINGMYRKILSTAKTIPNLGGKNNAITDNSRWKIQSTFIEIFKYLIIGLGDGKHGFFRGKWAARRIVNGTRNVLSSMDASSPVMGREDEIRPTDTMMGLFQGLKSILPVAIYRIRTTFLPNIDAGNGKLFLVDPKTLRRGSTMVDSIYYDKFTTDEGIEKLINGFNKSASKHEPIMVNNKFIALIYNDGKEYRVFYDIGELPDHKPRKFVSGISYAELLYLSGHTVWNDYFTLFTRFPVAGEDSTYSSTIRLTTTARTKMLWPLNPDWTTREEIPAIDFPLRDVKEFMSSMAPHPSRIKRAQADFDGDTGSGDSVYTDESLAENNKMLHTAAFWIKGNEMAIDINTDIVRRTLANMLGDPVVYER